jgi:hypothetical protein
MYANSKRTLWWLAASVLLTASVSAQEIDVRISVKYILDAGNNRPVGTYSTNQSLINIFNQVNNNAMRRWNRGYRYVLTEFQNVFGQSSLFNVHSSTFFNLDSTQEYYNLELAAEADPGVFFWRTNAVNLFIVNTASVGGGAAAIPSLPIDAGFELVIFTVNVNPTDVLWPHELGHHFNLYHTWGNDNVADTQNDPTPFQCTMPFGCTMGGSMECCCATKLANLNAAATTLGWSLPELMNIQFNNMSYHCNLTLSNIVLTDGQLDRWTDATRQYDFLTGEVSGLTYFVDWTNSTAPFNGYSTDPYRTVAGGIAAANAAGGDIVLIRTGAYDEPMTVTKPVTLRPSRGPATIGE